MKQLVLRTWVDGEVAPKGRPRCSCAGGRPRLYTPAKTRKWEQVAAMVFAAHKIRSAGRSERLSVVVKVYRAIPKAGGHGIGDWCAVGADSDNYAKSILDALQLSGVVPDDRQVVELTVQKYWGSPGANVEVWSFDEDNS